MQAGEDASCLNLYQTMKPRSDWSFESFIDHGGFGWASTAATTEAERQNPWLLLNQDLGQTPSGDPIVPVVIDQATAMYSLHLSGVGAKYVIQNGAKRAPTLQVVGLLKNSVLQGRVDH